MLHFFFFLMKASLTKIRCKNNANGASSFYDNGGLTQVAFLDVNLEFFLLSWGGHFKTLLQKALF